MIATRRKPKSCKICDREFYPFQTTQKVCSTDCAIQLAKAKQAREYAAETRKLKREHRGKDRSYQLRKAQEAFNAYIRTRDAGKPCISCGSTTAKMTAGHYKTVGAHPALRFHEDNCHNQCWWNCNSNKSGNIIEMRRGMVERIGVERVEWLEGPHETQNLTLEDIIEIKEWFKWKRKNIAQG